MGTEVLRMDGIFKVYPNGLIANNRVTFSVNEGEIHALLGENGAGKTTLMNILFGLEPAQEGSIYLYGEKVDIKNPLDAIQKGIGMVHQHFKLVPSMSVAENILLGMEPRTKWGAVDVNAEIQLAKETMEKYNMVINPYDAIEDVQVGTKQQVEILKVLIRGAKILVLDEPTAVLTPQETEGLFQELKHLRATGHTIIFISHKLNEVMEICDRFTVLRNGELVGVKNVSESSPSEMSSMMIGRAVDLGMHKDAPQRGEVVIKVDNLSYTDLYGYQSIDHISFQLRAGEILGVAAIEGNGQNELAEILTGLRTYHEGHVTLCGQEVNAHNIRRLREMGMAHIPADRYVFGCSPMDTISDNLIADRYFKKPYCKRGNLQKKTIARETENMVDTFHIKCTSRQAAVHTLSGGNVQKVIVAREFTSNPKLIVANQPTRGIDVGSAEQIRHQLVKMSRDGSGVVLISADFDELLEASDRIIVMNRGRLVAHFPDASVVDRFELGAYMLGIKEQSLEELRGAAE